MRLFYGDTQEDGRRTCGQPAGINDAVVVDNFAVNLTVGFTACNPEFGVLTRLADGLGGGQPFI